MSITEDFKKEIKIPQRVTPVEEPVEDVYEEHPTESILEHIFDNTDTQMTETNNTLDHIFNQLEENNPNDLLEKSFDVQHETVKELQKIGEKLNEPKEKKPEVQKVSIEGIELVTIKGKDGNDGKTPTPEEITSLIKPLIPEPIKGDDGYTPVKNKDYFDGKDGYTPKKGVDYFDGIDGYTPKKGVDYFDGEKGDDGKDLTFEDINLDLIAEKINPKLKYEFIMNAPQFRGGGLSRATTFLELTDTPNSYTSQSGKGVRVNSTATGLEFYTTTDSDEKVKHNASDPTAGYLDDKITKYNFLTSYTETDPVFTAWLGTSPLSGYVPTSRTITINGTALDLSQDRSWTVSGMVYPTSNGIPVYNGTGWGTSISGTSSQFVKGDGSLDSSTYLTSVEGTAVKSTGEAGGTKFLRENGDGTCSWQTAGGSASQWTTTGSDIYYSTGKVSIGLNTGTGQFNLQSLSTAEGAGVGDELLTSSGWNTSFNWWGDFATGFWTSTGSASQLQNSITATVGKTYAITLTFLGYTSGSVSAIFGGYTQAGITGTTTVVLTATTTGNLRFTPTTTFDGGFLVSMKEVSGTYTPTATMYDSTGTASVEIRNNLASKYNMYFGLNAGYKNYTGTYNTVFGANSLVENVTGYGNSSLGAYSLNANSSGYDISSFGKNSLKVNTSGYGLSSFGSDSLQANTTGYLNSSYGYKSQYANTTAYENSSLGAYSMYANTTGKYNTATGAYALYTNTTSDTNSAFGYKALYTSNGGSSNAGIGSYALYSLTSGGGNIGLGGNSGYGITTGNYNIGIGYDSLRTNAGNHNNIAIGYQAFYSKYNGGNNVGIGHNVMKNSTIVNRTVALGEEAGSFIANGSSDNSQTEYAIYIGALSKAKVSSGSNEIVIGYNAIGEGSNTAKIGNTNLTKVASHGDFEALDVGDGFILKSPDGTRFRINVANDGTLSAVSL